MKKLLFIAAFILAFNSIAYPQNIYKVRLKQGSGDGGLIVTENAASRTAAITQALADSDAGTDVSGVDCEKISTGEAAARGQATQATLAAAKTDLDNLTLEVADATNSTTSNLTSGSTFTGGYVSLAGFESVSISVRSDQNSATNGLVVSWSDDGTNALMTQSYTVTSSAKFIENFTRRAIYYKVAYTNGGTNQSQFALITTKIPRLKSYGTTNVPYVVSNPVFNTVGTQANAWSAATVTTNGTSNAVDCQYIKCVTVFGNSSGATTIAIQVSQDNSNWYSTGTNQVLAGSGDFGINATIGARYVRLMSSASSVTITATIAGKE